MNQHAGNLEWGGLSLNLGLLAITGLLSACAGGLQGVDQRAEKIMREHTRLLGIEDATPIITHQNDPDENARQTIAPNPPTTNPRPEEMIFKPVDPTDDIAARFARLIDIPEDAPRTDLAEVLQIAMEHSREYQTAREELLLASLRLLAERHRWGPRFFNEVSATVDADAMDADYDTALRLVNEFRVTHRLPDGGDIAIRALVNATQQLRERVTGNESQDATLILSANLPLLRGAGSIARESLINTERLMVYATRTFERFRRRFLFDIASDYFDLIQAAVSIDNAKKVLKSRHNLMQEAQSRYEKGKTSESDLSEARQRVLSSENSLASRRDRFLLQTERFRIRLGLSPDTPLFIDEEDELRIPVPDLDMIESIRHGLAYRLDLQNDRDRLDDSRRAVANARNDLLPDLDLSLSMNVITNPDLKQSGLQFDFEETDFTGSITFGLPLDREIERIGVRQAMVSLERATRNLRETEDEIAVSVRSTIRAIELARLSLNLQDESVRVIENRMRGLQLNRANVPSRRFIDAQDDLIDALDQLARAQRDLRVAILRFLLESGQFRVDRRGQLIPPAGLETNSTKRAPNPPRNEAVEAIEGGESSDGHE